MFERVAHRGGAGLAPENTLAAFSNALTLTGTDEKERIVDAVECDVQMSRDGKIVVFHDNTVERLTGGKGNILDLNFAYLRGLNAAAHFPGGWPRSEQIPTLAEVLRRVQDQRQRRIYIEIKNSERDGNYARYPNIAESLVSDVRGEHMVERALIISFDWLILPSIRSLEPRLETGAILDDRTWNGRDEDMFKSFAQQMQLYGCSWINMDQKLCSDAVVDIVHEHGMKLGLWTVNSVEDMRRFAAMGVDSITSDRPDLFALI